MDLQKYFIGISFAGNVSGTERPVRLIALEGRRSSEQLREIAEEARASVVEICPGREEVRPEPLPNTPRVDVERLRSEAEDAGGVLRQQR